MSKTSFDTFALEYDKQMGDQGDYCHQQSIDPALFSALGDVTDHIIYDIGCGNGYISRKLVRLGAKQIWASDISPALVEIAKDKYDSNKIKYFVKDGSDFTDIPSNTFNAVILNMSIHYIPDLDSLFQSIARCLTVGGRLVFTTNHPFRSLAYHDTPIGTDLSEVLHDARSYTQETTKISHNHWDTNSHLSIYYRPFSMYINHMSKHKLLVNQLIEPSTARLLCADNPTQIQTPIPSKFAISAIKTT